MVLRTFFIFWGQQPRVYAIHRLLTSFCALDICHRHLRRLAVRRLLRGSSVDRSGVSSSSRDEVDADHLRLARLDGIRQLSESEAYTRLLPFHLHRLVLLPTMLLCGTLVFIHALVDGERQLPSSRHTLRHDRRVKGQQNSRLVIM